MSPVNVQRFDSSALAAGADLVFTQTAAGQYLSFYWQDADQYRLQPEQVVGQFMQQVFTPVALAPYLERVRQVLNYLIPVQFEYAFIVAGQYLVFDITLSPVLMPHGIATTVVATGRFLYTVSERRAQMLVNAVRSDLSLYTNRSFKRLAQIIWNIRQTLDLRQIWKQTVDGLGEAFEVSRCLIYPYRSGGTELLQAAAEYAQPHLAPLSTIQLHTTDPAVHEALTTLRPVLRHKTPTDEPAAVLLVATSYQDQANGLIALHQLDPDRTWSEIEMALLRDMADQIGTGVAHASLFQDSRNLAEELRRLNESLMRQHSDLEEARQQAEAASRLKSEFLANTSHELRTPLNGMIGFLKLILDGLIDEPEEQLQCIQESYRSAMHLMDVIQDILDVAKIEAGKMQIDLNPIRLNELLIDVENFTRPQAQQKNLSFEIRAPETRDEIVLYGNYQRLKQVMLNLVGNAIKFTHEGSITISVEIVPGKVVVQDEEKPGSLKISVADTGIGVSLEKQDRLFQTFSQIDGSRTRQYGGTGLGLAISQKLVEAMGGIVNFFSMGEGLGSTVTFTVPLYIDPVPVTPLPDSADLLR